MVRRPRLSIATRVFLGFALVLTSFATLAVGSINQHQRNAKALRLLDEGYLPLALTVGEARSTQALFAALLERVLQEERSETARDWLRVTRRSRPATLRRALHGLSRVESLAEDAGVHARVEEVRSELEAVQRLMVVSEGEYESLSEALAGGQQEDAERIVSQLHRREHEIRIHFRQAWRGLQAAISEISEEASLREQETAQGLLFLTIIAMGIGLATTFWAQRLLRPLSLLQERVAAVTRGDEGSEKLEIQRDDELGRLTAAFETMVETLKSRGASLKEATQAQRQLRQLQAQIVTGLRSAIVVIDADGYIGTINPAAGRMMKVEDADLGTSFHSIAFCRGAPEIIDAVEQVRSGLERVDIAELKVGEQRLNISVQPVVPEQEGTHGPLLVVAEDVTEELLTKGRLIQTERLAAIGRMAAHVTHEVRNPLSSIGLNVELLEEEFAQANPGSLSLVRAIQKELDRLKGLTDEYLRLARIPTPLLEPDDMGGLLHSVISFIRPEMESHKIGLDLQITDNLPQVALDEGQVRQVCLNLLRNARESMSAGGTIQVVLEKAEDGVLLAVVDEGVGIPAVERERIFDLFYTTKDSGTGLGLALTRQIVMAHGGRIRCTDAAGQGTRFELWLPAVRANPDVRRSA